MYICIVYTYIHTTNYNDIYNGIYNDTYNDIHNDVHPLQAGSIMRSKVASGFWNLWSRSDPVWLITFCIRLRSGERERQENSQKDRRKLRFSVSAIGGFGYFNICLGLFPFAVAEVADVKESICPRRLRNSSPILESFESCLWLMLMCQWACSLAS